MFKVGEHGEVPAPEVYFMTDFDKWTRLSFYVFLIDSSDGYILLNTGLVRDLTKSNKFLKQWAGSDRCRLSVSDDQKMDQILKRCSLSEDDIAHVILSPVQDHTVGSLDLFRTAKIYFSRMGWYQEVVNPHARQLVFDRDVALPAYIRSYLFEDAWSRIRLVENEEILEGLSVRWTGAHHRSSMSVVLKMKEKLIGITDAAFTWRNIEDNIPIGIAEDIHEALDAYEYLRKTCDNIIPAYDPENVIRFKEFLGA